MSTPPPTLRCEVGSKPSAWSAYLDWNWYHRWPNGDRATGRCLNCGKTLAESRLQPTAVTYFSTYERRYSPRALPADPKA